MSPARPHGSAPPHQPHDRRSRTHPSHGCPLATSTQDRIGTGYAAPTGALARLGSLCVSSHNHMDTPAPLNSHSGRVGSRHVAAPHSHFQSPPSPFTHVVIPVVHSQVRQSSSSKAWASAVGAARSPGIAVIIAPTHLAGRKSFVCAVSFIERVAYGIDVVGQIAPLQMRRDGAQLRRHRPAQ